MPTLTYCADRTTGGGDHGVVPETALREDLRRLPGWPPVEPLTVATIAESAEAVIEHLDAPAAAGAAVLEGLAAPPGSGPAGRRAWDPGDAPAPPVAGVVPGDDGSDGRAISIDEYAKAVLYNGLGHYHAARAAAERACEHDGFVLLAGALAELVEAGVRSGHRGAAADALPKLEDRARASGSEWALGVAACSRALLTDGDAAEESYLEAIERLGGTRAGVALGRVHLLYGEWLRRRGRRVDAREQLARAHSAFNEAGLGGFAERARRELLATGETVRKRTDDTRLDLTAQEAEIAQLAASGSTNLEIGERLFISPRTVEWHLRKVFTKVGVSSRRELKATFHLATAAAG